ncbi:MAG: hypothetical protein AAF579_22330 [Cyanobacteria bacterium P01_C01_bin.118]
MGNPDRGSDIFYRIEKQWAATVKDRLTRYGPHSQLGFTLDTLSKERFCLQPRTGSDMALKSIKFLD